MMDIAAENNFSETAFTVKVGEGYDLRWFTPGGEIDLCGYATLATAYVLFNYYENDANKIVFHTLSGNLFCRRCGEYIEMDFPVYSLDEVPVTDEMTDAMRAAPKEYGITYIPVSDFTSPELCIKKMNELPEIMSHIRWIDDDFFNDGSKDFDQEAFEIIDSGVDYMNPNHFSVKELIQVINETKL